MQDEGDIIKSTATITAPNSILDDTSIKKVLEEKQSNLYQYPSHNLEKVDMGPRWSEEELDIFLKRIRI